MVLICPSYIIEIDVSIWFHSISNPFIFEVPKLWNQAGLKVENMMERITDPVYRILIVALKKTLYHHDFQRNKSN